MWRSISITVFIIFCGVSLPSVAQEQKGDTLSFRVFQAWQAWKPYTKPVEQPAKKKGKKKQHKNQAKGVDTVRINEEIGQKARFMSIDPLWEKYRSWTPYQYAANNPLMYIDPSGREIWISYETSRNIDGINYVETHNVQYKGGKLYNEDGSSYKGNNKYVSQVANYLNDLKASDNVEVVHRLTTLETSDKVHTLKEYDQADKFANTTEPSREGNIMLGERDGSTVYFNPSIGNPLLNMAHELLGHSYLYDTGKNNWENEPNTGIPMREIQAVNIENIVRATFGYPKRTTYEPFGAIPKELLWDTHIRR